MSIAWITPLAIAGIALVALPIAVHLLVRQPVRRVSFPSLRFLRESQLAALRRRSIQDAWLLLCRAAIVALAAVALAGPVLRTDARTAAYGARTSRAIVVVESADDSLLGPIRAGSFRTATFRRVKVRDGLADAVRWLDAQPPSAREIVVTGLMRRGSVSEADLAVVPPDVGIRFDPVRYETASATQVAVLAQRDGAQVRIERTIVAGLDSTRATDGNASPLPNDLVRINAAAADRDLASAALRASLAAGVLWADFATPVLIVWEGGDVTAPAGTRVIRMPVPHPASASADAVLAALLNGTPRPELKEPVAITREQIASWTRLPGPVSQAAPLADEGDRRWLWGGALILLLVEWWLRGPRNVATPVQEGEVRAA